MTAGTQHRMIPAADKAAIRQMLDRMREAWADGDGSALASLFTEDARYVEAHMLREKQENMAKWTGPENHVLNARLARGRCRPRCTTAGQRRPGWQTRLRLFHRPGFPGLGGDFDANAAPGAAA